MESNILEKRLAEIYKRVTELKWYQLKDRYKLLKKAVIMEQDLEDYRKQGK